MLKIAILFFLNKIFINPKILYKLKEYFKEARKGMDKFRFFCFIKDSEIVCIFGLEFIEYE